jgi:Protein of unknown function (DUF3089)
VKAAARPPVDCFYVYPTVSLQQTGNSNRDIDVQEGLIAILQASQFSQVCRVFAPMYRQITFAGLRGEGSPNPYVPYYDVLDAWRDYLANWNHGRGVVLIGHSQGAEVLEQLVKEQVDGKPARRRQLVSAILLGGNVPVGRYSHVPACASATQTSCLVAYSSFDSPPPANAPYAVSAKGKRPVLCVNPAAPGGHRSAPLTPIFPAELIGVRGGRLGFEATTPWVSFPGRYTATCKRTATASWLQIDHRKGDKRPLVRPLGGAAGGLHADDVNIALGDLVALVRSQSTAYVSRRK